MGKLGVVAGGAVLLGAVYVGGSWWLGHEVGAALPVHLARAAEQLGVHEVKQVSYDRGIFESRIASVLKMELALPPEPGSLPKDDDDDDAEYMEEDMEDGMEDDEASVQDQVLKGMHGIRRLPIEVHLVQTVRHGPLVGGKPVAAVIQTRVDHVEGLDDEMRKALEGASAPWADTVVSLNGASRTHAVLPAGKITGSDADGVTGQMHWQEAVADIETSSSRREQTVDIRWPGLTVDIPLDRKLAQKGEASSGKSHIRMELAGFSAHSAMNRIEPDLWVMAPGTWNMSLQNWSTSMHGWEGGDESKTVLAMTDWKGKGEGVLRNGVLSFADDAHGRLTIVNVPLDKVSFSDRLSNIPTASVRPVQELMVRLGRATDPMKALPPEKEGRELVRTFSASSPSLGLDLTATAGEGAPLAASFSVDLGPVATDSPAPLAMAVMRALKVQAQVTLPKTWLNHVNQRFVAKNPDISLGDCDFSCTVGQIPFVEDKGDRWMVSAAFNQGQVMVNDQEVMRF